MSENYNVDLLMQVREKIVNEPEKHQQDTWARADKDPREGDACGTAYCVAGWAAVLDGQKLAWYGNEEAGYGARFIADPLDDDGFQVSISCYARQALGLSVREDGLFDGSNTRKQVLAALDLLIEAGKNGERVPHVDFLTCLRA